MPSVEPLLIFDLDGTILRRNSFPLWAMGMAWPPRRVGLSLAVTRLLLARKLRRMDHDTLHRRLQALWQSAVTATNGAIATRLQTRLLRLVRPSMTPVLRLVAEDVMDGIMATAAAAEYAVPLGQELGFSIIMATPAARPADEPCNSGEQKSQRVMALLREKDWIGRPRIFFNDDLADVPLMRASHAVCWFGSSGDLRKAEAAAPGVRFVSCRGMRPSELSATVAHLGQSLAAAQLANMPWLFPASPRRPSTVS